MTAVNYASYALIHGLPPAAGSVPAKSTAGSFGDLLSALDPFSSKPATKPATAAAGAPAAAASSDDSGLTFDDLLDVVNPLQHFPVVSTLYRAITGDTIKTLPKIAGDALYGGLPGLVSSVADTVFEKITGKSVGDTVLGYAEDLFRPDASEKVASATTASGQGIASLGAPAVAASVPGQDALVAALGRNGVDQDIALRAAAAYRSTVSAALN